MSPRHSPPAVQDASWYHTIELPGGTVTPGEYDLRPTLERIPFPPSLEGARCLDVGTRDGFWAFAMEQRGAREVVAIDLDDHERLDFPEPRPDLSDAVTAELAARRQAFAIAHEALGSSVERLNLSVYDLDPGEVGQFDFVFLGTLLLHLRDPIGALMAVRRVLRGTLLLNEPIAPALRLPRGPAATLLTLPGAPFWWLPNREGLQQYLRRAGYDVRATGRPYFVGRGAAAVPRPQGSRRSPAALRALVASRFGMPHAWVIAQPRGRP
jgi:tRNA (mo5U34)-methyltransferase